LAGSDAWRHNIACATLVQMRNAKMPFVFRQIYIPHSAFQIPHLGDVAQLVEQLYRRHRSLPQRGRWLMVTDP
jgi:hypothetical protein